MSTTLLGRRYVLHEPLGQGGMGAVYRATDRLSGSPVAVKRVTAGLGSTSAGVRAGAMDSDHLRLALAQEFQVLATLRNPHVISVLDYGFDDEGWPFYAMELLERPRTILQAGRGRPLAVRLALLLQVLQALAYLHRRGILHRDLKPSNVLVVEGRVKVLDFGLAVAGQRATGKVGTLAYMAPDVLLDRPVGEHADLYALGVIAYELIAGRHPFDVRDAKKLVEQVLNQPPDLGPLLDPDAGARGELWERDTGAVDSDAPLPQDAPTLGRPAPPEAPAPPAAAPQPTEGPPREGAPPGLAQVVGRLLAKRPAEGYPDADSVIHELCHAGGLEPPENGESRESWLQAARFVGRESELERLGQGLEDALAGRGGAWLVGGESGVGKSRLLQELRTRALVRGALVLDGQAVAEGGGPYHVWRGPLRRLALSGTPDEEEAAALLDLVPDIGELLERPVAAAPPLPPEEGQRRLLRVTLSLLQRAQRPVALLLEDLQWAEEGSLALLAELGRAAAERPLLLVASYREDERADLPATLGSFARLSLPRLDRVGIGELAGSVLGEAGRSHAVIDWLARETEGNAFFLVEAMRALADQAGRLQPSAGSELPEPLMTGGVRHMVERRLARVPERARERLRLAAVIGREIDLELLRALAGAPEPADELARWLDHCHQALVLGVQGGRWAFAHDKLREGVLAELDAEARAALHRRVASALAALRGEDPEAAAALAHHYSQGGEWREAAHHHARAAQAAARLFALSRVRDHQTAALHALARVADAPEVRRRRIDALVQLVRASFFSDPPEANFARLDEAERLLGSLPEASPEDGQRRAWLHYARGRTHYVANDTRAAIRHFKEVVAFGREIHDPELIALPASVLGRALAVQGHYAKASALLERALAPLERLGQRLEWISTLGFRAIALAGCGRSAEARREANRTLAEADALGNALGAAIAHITRHYAYLLLGDAERARAEGRGAVAAAERSGDRLYHYVGLFFLAWAEARLGRLREAQELLTEARQIAAPLGPRILVAEQLAACEAELAWLSGDAERAATLAGRAAELARAADSLIATGLAERTWAEALAALGRADEAEAHFASSLQALEQGEARVEAARTRVAWARHCRERDRLERARELLTAAAEAFETAELHDEAESARGLLAG